MKNITKSLSVLLVLVVACGVLCACASDVTPTPKETTDKFRTYYQIFPYSFADSNGDGIGDIQGIIDKLDYIEQLNFDGIWLTPVHQSTTYHKYDVVDYYSIDKQFGTLEDYDRLVSECHKRGMTVLLDLVFNHTAKSNAWFDECMWAHMRNKTDYRYYNYYNVKKVSSGSVLDSGWHRYNDSLVYEGVFWDKMPDLNLQNVLDEPDGYLATELKDIMKFWLVDHNVDGFRLDATTEYFAKNQQLNTEFLTWLNSTAKAIKSDCYIVGEGSWGSSSENKYYQQSGVDSFFAFQNGYNANGNFSYSVRLEKAAYLYTIDQDTSNASLPGIPANFIANHDTGRAYGTSVASAQPNNLKEIFGLMAMTYGATFTYYGDDVGMSIVAGSTYDEDKRQPMPWGDEYTCKPVAGSTAAEDSVKYPYGTVDVQLKDANSLPNYIMRANAIRRAFPQIARCVAQRVYLNDTRSLCVVSKGEGAEKIYIVWNASHGLTQSFDVSSIGSALKIGATLSVDNDYPTLKGNNLTLPPMSFVVLINK